MAQMTARQLRRRIRRAMSVSRWSIWQKVDVAPGGSQMTPRQLRRRFRRAMNVRNWSMRQRIAVGVWIPVLVVAFALFTGPFRTSGAASAPPVTTTTVVGTPIVAPYTPKTPLLKVTAGPTLQQQIDDWVSAHRPVRTPAERLALARYRHLHHAGAATATGTKVAVNHRSAPAKPKPSSAPAGKSQPVGN